MFSNGKYVAGYSLAYCLLCAVSMIISAALAGNSAMHFAMVLTFLPFGPVISAIGTVVHVRKKLNWRIPLLWLILAVIMWIASIVVFISCTGGV